MKQSIYSLNEIALPRDVPRSHVFCKVASCENPTLDFSRISRGNSSAPQTVDPEVYLQRSEPREAETWSLEIPCAINCLKWFNEETINIKWLNCEFVIDKW